MWWGLLLTSVVVMSAIAEPPVPQSYGPPGGEYSSGYPGSSSQFSGNGYNSERENPRFTHEQDFQRSPGVIWGKWTVALPDGRVQTVEYDADQSGFHPVVTFDDPNDRSYNNGGGAGNRGYNY